MYSQVLSSEFRQGKLLQGQGMTRKYREWPRKFIFIFWY